MFVCYPALLASASLTLECIRFHVPRICSQYFVRFNHSRLRAFNLFTTAILVLFCVLSFSRILAIISSYSAPYKVYQQVNPVKLLRTESVICIGDIWYQYPSSFLLPDGARAAFIEGEFKGLLPGLFLERPAQMSALKWSHALGSKRQDFNDRNLKEPSHYVRSSQYHLLLIYRSPLINAIT